MSAETILSGCDAPPAPASELTTRQVAEFAAGVLTVTAALAARLVRHGLLDASELAQVFDFLAGNPANDPCRARALREAAGFCADLTDATKNAASVCAAKVALEWDRSWAGPLQ